MQRRPFNWVVVLVGIGLAGVVAVSAASALAARSAASPFELVAIDRYEGDCPDWWTCPGGTYVATFTSGAPFCESGTFDHVVALWQNPPNARRYTCSDGSGSLTLAEHRRGQVGDWTIVEGSGRHADLRGEGSHSYEVLSEYPPVGVFRTTFQGVVGTDAVAPSVAFTSASATKLRRPAGFYAIRVGLSLRDDVEENTVAYRLRVKEGPEHARDRRLVLLAEKEGSTASGSVSTRFRFLPSSKRVRSVQLLLSGSDPVGNEVSIARSLKLPR
jgi:hypothetical protein